MRRSNRRRDRSHPWRLRGEGNVLMTTPRIRGTARERAIVVAMILASAALPVVAKLPLFQDIVWVFWLAALALILSALALVLRIMWRDQSSSDS